MIKRFSVGYGMEKRRKKEQEKEIDQLHDTHLKINNKGLSGEITHYMLSLNFNLDQIVTAYKIYKFTTIDEAIQVMMKDPDSGNYLHKYIYQKADRSMCAICNDDAKYHTEFEEEGDYYINTLRVKDTQPTQINRERDSNKNLPTMKNPNIRETEVNLKKPINISKINLILPSEVLNDFEDDRICRICFSTKMTQEGVNFITFDCNHSVCKTCIYNYLKVSINNGRVLSVPCIYGGCQRRFSDEEIKTLTDEQLWNKYKKFKYQQIRLNLEDAYMVPCPWIDCIEVVEADPSNKETMITCDQGHKFCSKCKTTGWHKVGKCLEVSYLIKLV
jgi:hypothetical protein